MSFRSWTDTGNLKDEPIATLPNPEQRAPPISAWLPGTGVKGAGETECVWGGCRHELAAMFSLLCFQTLKQRVTEFNENTGWASRELCDVR